MLDRKDNFAFSPFRAFATDGPSRGFTLIEILVVMAISVILMGLVMEPIVQSFQMTRQAEAMADAQDAARAGMLDDQPGTGPGDVRL